MMSARKRRGDGFEDLDRYGGDDEATIDIGASTAAANFPSWLPARPDVAFPPPPVVPEFDFEAPRQRPARSTLHSADALQQPAPPSRPPLSAASASDEAVRARGNPFPSAPSLKPSAAPSSGVTTCPLQLLWFDPSSLEAVREQPAWRLLVAERELERFAYSEDLRTDDGQRRVFRDVLAAATPSTAPDLRASVEQALKEPEFEPPLVLVEGELAHVFDEVETLKATTMVVTTVAGGDKMLSGPLAAATAFLEASVFQHSGEIASRLTANISRAFRAEKRILSHDKLDAIILRTLIERRSYQRRQLYGGTWIRTQLTPDGAKEPTPCYVPSELDQKLPMFPRLRVRLIAAVDIRQDPEESCPVALKTVAFARVVSLPA